MPKRVDHAVRKNEIIEAVIAIAVRGGLNSATFREVAAEAGISVRLIQYYFGTRDQLLLETQQHIARLMGARIAKRVAKAGTDPAEVLRAILMTFIPRDEASRKAMLMFIVLHTASLVQPELARPEAHDVPAKLRQLVVAQLERAKGNQESVELDAAMLVALPPTLAQMVLDGSSTPAHATRVLDHAIARALG